MIHYSFLEFVCRFSPLTPVLSSGFKQLYLISGHTGEYLS
jgi:hypothetical protein